MKALAKLQIWWAQRIPRERQLLLAMLAVVSIATVWSTWSWTRSEGQRLAKVLPATRAKLATMREDAAELQRLRRLPPKNSASAASLADVISASARARGLALEVKPAGDELHVIGPAPFDALVLWLGEIHRDYGLRLVRFSATRTGAEAQVDALVSASQ